MLDTEIKNSKKNWGQSPILVAMSGGVDSSFASYLLKERGALVEGAFMYFCPNSRCCAPEAEARAERTAKELQIPFHRIDASAVFAEKVIGYFLKSMRMGLTPNPCTICNEQVKFGFLLDYALQKGFSHLATGHYARVVYDRERAVFRLLKGKDERKDQSYMLYRLNQKTLPFALFPLGDWRKAEVVRAVRKLGWEAAEVKESQDLCFIPKGMGLKEFLEPFGFPFLPGPILDTSGKVIGTHQGLYAYTMGQRRGIRLPGGPFYVLAQDFSRNALIVGRKEEVFKTTLIAGEINWVVDPPPAFPFWAKARIRYGHKEAPAMVERFEEDKLKVVFQEPQFAITPGQALVLFHEEEVLGGGVILRALD
jgi:tRNA-specific 2-thiouridylase